jgi:hypothetical protein
VCLGNTFSLFENSLKTRINRLARPQVLSNHITQAKTGPKYMIPLMHAFFYQAACGNPRIDRRFLEPLA